jgi:5'-3' exonuclease
MKKFLIVDTNHLFYRVRHGLKGSSEEKVSLALHVIFSSLLKAWNTHGGDHIVFALDGRSWRKDFYTPYKKNREVKRAARTETEVEEETEFENKFNIFRNFITTSTNCTILQNNKLEADDVIAGFIQSHPSDHHTILSSDGDFEQLLANNVVQYNGMADELITLNGIFKGNGKQVTDKKTGLPKACPDPEWSVFEKSVRGCSTDNVFSAYPGVREKGSKNKVGLREAFEDRHKKGYSYSNLMMQRWVDHNNVEHRVIDDYNRNRTLVDLTAQPDEIKSLIAETIKESCKPRNNTIVGLKFLKFCGQFDLVKLTNSATQISKMLSTGYPGV